MCVIRSILNFSADSESSYLLVQGIGDVPLSQRQATRTSGVHLIERCTFVLYAYVRSFIEVSQFRRCSVTERRKRTIMELLYSSVWPLVCGQYEEVGRS